MSECVCVCVKEWVSERVSEAITSTSQPQEARKKDSSYTHTHSLSLVTAHFHSKTVRPVGAMPTTSRSSSSAGMPCIWMVGVMALKVSTNYQTSAKSTSHKYRQKTRTHLNWGWARMQLAEGFKKLFGHTVLSQLPKHDHEPWCISSFDLYFELAS